MFKDEHKCGNVLPTDALIVVDMQADFLHTSSINPNGGKFGVSGGEYASKYVEVHLTIRPFTRTRVRFSHTRAPAHTYGTRARVHECTRNRARTDGQTHACAQALIRRFSKAGSPIVATRDYHPIDHCSFAGGSNWLMIAFGDQFGPRLAADVDRG